MIDAQVILAGFNWGFEGVVLNSSLTLWSNFFNLHLGGSIDHIDHWLSIYFLSGIGFVRVGQGLGMEFHGGSSCVSPVSPGHI